MAACADIPLEASPTKQLVIASAKPSESTYRALITAARACYPTRGVRVDGDYFPESRVGVMTVTMAFDTNAIGLLRVEVAPAGGGSQVVATYRPRTEEFEEAVPRWLAGDSGLCPYR